MRYSENKDESYELLRLALPLMAQQASAYHPVSYALWYEHVGGLNEPLSTVLTARLEEKKPLTEEEAYQLHARFIAARDDKVFDTLEQRLRALLEDTAEHTATAGQETGRFRRILADTRSELTGGMNPEGVHSFISLLLTETSRMESSTDVLARKLETSLAIIRTLAQALIHSRSEALLDSLSGLNNLRAFNRAAQKLADEAGGQLAGVALLLADIDHFKQVNDTYGHLLGDKALQFVAQTMLSNIKGRDVAARIGGEEFAILLPQTTLEGAVTLAEKLRQAIADGRIQRRGQDIDGTITVSIGVAVGQPGETLDALRQRADSALYSAKKEGRNRVCTSPAV